MLTKSEASPNEVLGGAYNAMSTSGLGDRDDHKEKSDDAVRCAEMKRLPDAANAPDKKQRGRPREFVTGWFLQ